MEMKEEEDLGEKMDEMLVVMYEDAEYCRRRDEERS